MEVSLAEILGIENEYDLLSKQAKVRAQTILVILDELKILIGAASLTHTTSNNQSINQILIMMKHHLPEWRIFYLLWGQRHCKLLQED